MRQQAIRIATRRSSLAMWQANFIKTRLALSYPKVIVSLIPIMTQGDKLLATPLDKIGGKGLFIKELEIAMMEHRADLAVHSLKDVPYELPDGFCLAAVCERDNPFDAFVSNEFSHVNELPQNAIVGTSSLRRQCQLKAMRPDLRVETLRGNVGTRLCKLDEKKYHAIILAAAGLKRLQLSDRIRHIFTADELLPAVGQGALAIECREDDHRLIDLLKPLNHHNTKICVFAERAMNTALGGSCQLPIAVYAVLDNDKLIIEGLVGSPDGKTILREKLIGDKSNSDKIGKQLALNLLAKGADKILRT